MIISILISRPATMLGLQACLFIVYCRPGLCIPSRTSLAPSVFNPICSSKLGHQIMNLSFLLLRV